MALTQLADISVFPTNVSEYISQQSLETNAFWQSGIIKRNTNATVQAALDGGGFEAVFPFFNDLTGSGQIMQEGTNLTTGKVTTGFGKAPVMQRAEGWAVEDLVEDYSGEDIMGYIGDRISDWWSRHYSGALLSVCAGAVGAVTDNVLDISGLTGAAAVIDADSFIDAEHLLGDRRKKLTAVGMHSKTVASLRKQGLITTIPAQDGVAYAGDYYGDKRVVEDDTMTNSGGIYTSYLFAEGSILFGEGKVKVPQEIERQAAVNGGQESIYTRKRVMFVPTGVSFTGSVTTTAPKNPSNAELATTSKWTLVDNQKNIGIVKFIHKIA